MIRLYLAGPMTGYPEFNFPAFHAESARLRALGFQIVNPAEIVVDQSVAWLECMRADIKQLVDCDCVALLPRWNESRGASIEQRLARDLGLRVFVASHLIGLLDNGIPVLSSAAVELIEAEAA
jgi:hypothetical protein